MKQNLIYILLSMVIGSCAKNQRDDCLTSLGDVSEETREVGSFGELYVDDRIKVTLVPDSAREGLIELRGPSNLLVGITTEVKDGELRLINSNTCNFVRSFDYDIVVLLYTESITKLTVESIAKVTTSDTLDIDKLNVFHNGLSDIDLMLKGNEVFVQSLNSAQTTLRGKVKVLKGSIEEISNLIAIDLECEEVYLDSHTPLDCSIDASVGMYMNINNSGDIVYLREPLDYKILASRTGTGVLRLK